MGAVGRIAAVTAREIIGERLFVSVFGGSLIILLLSLVVAPLQIGEQHKLFYDLGMAFAAFFLLLYVLLVGAQQVAGNRENGGLVWLLTRPVQRWQVLLGIFLALAGVGACSHLSLTTVFFVLLSMVGEPVTTGFLVAALFLYLKYLLLLGIVVLLSTFCSQFAAIFLALLLFVGGHGTVLFSEVGGQVGGLLGLVGLGIYHLLPDFGAFQLASAAFHQQLPSSSSLVRLAIYSLAYLTAVLVLACWRFARSDIS
ncbi:MAG: ABC transporter permease subunit [Deltaproteobacteria bacterium]|nr:ABC transporter permease subunit [Candidatus Anaeroferrophillus wilburensis]MBN2889437.1 ABC transporter permease subunit [Deltaproteobacteria bacterium]